MSKFSILKKPQWDTSLPDFIALRKYMAHCDTFATQLTGPHTEDGHGLSHLLYSPARFLAIKGTNPIVIANPGPYAAGLAGGALEQFKDDKRIYRVQEQNTPVFANAFEAGQPPRIRAINEVDFR